MTVRRIQRTKGKRRMMALLDVLGRRWTLRILWELGSEPAGLTFNELQRRCGVSSPSMLSRRLGELRDVGLVVVGSDGEYAPSKAARELEGPLVQIDEWAKRQLSR